MTTPDEPWGILINPSILPPGTEIHSFVTTGDLKRRINHARGSFNHTAGEDRYLVFQSIDPDTAEYVWSRWQTYFGKAARVAYDAAAQSLIVKLVGRPHEIAGSHIAGLIFHEAIDMHNQHELVATGSARVLTGRFGKEPDASFMPRTVPAGRSQHWPTVVVEVAFSESSVKPRTDTTWWIVESDGDVKMALAVHVSQDDRQFRLNAGS